MTLGETEGYTLIDRAKAEELLAEIEPG